MAARPPSNDLEDGPDVVEFGIAALDEHLDRASLSFPVDRGELVAALGDPEVPYDPNGNTVSFSTVVERTDQKTFEDRQDLLDAVHPEFERYRRKSGGLFSKLQSLVPGL